MSQSLIPVVPKISLYRDAVNVYVIQWDDGETGLFDLGSGAVLGAMQGAGMKAPSLVLHTDYRRDRVFGHHSHPGLPVAIGERDAPYLENAARIWQDLQVAHGYAGYERFLCPRLSVPAELRLTDGQLPRPWRKPYVYAQHLGAHTPGGMGYLIVDGDTRMLVSGDILQHDGTLHSIHELQRSYNFMEGLHALRRAVGWLASGDIDVLLPAHGDPVIGRENVMSAANAALERIDDFWSRWRLIWPDQPQGHVFDFDPITPHLRGASNRIQYAIVDDDGAAVFFDAGVSYPDGFETVLEDKGIRDVEWCIITHHHDDHLMGYDWLREKYGTRLATHECMVDVLERPQGYSLNCLHDRPYKVDMVMREGVPMRWRGFDIVPHFFPSQTEYHAVYFCEVDEQMVLFSGDALYWEADHETIRPTDPDWRNWFDVDGGYLVGAKLLRKYQPRLLAAAHVHPWPITQAACNGFEAHATDFHDSLRALVGRRHPSLGINPFLISVYPYRAQLQQRTHLEVRVVNPLDEFVVVRAQPRLPEGFSARPDKLEIELGPKERARVPLTIIPDAGLEIPARVIWTLRVIFDGEDLGEYCEGMLEAVVS